MPAATVRCLILAAVLAVGNLLLLGIGQTRVVREARWPGVEAQQLYGVAGWTPQAPEVEPVHGTVLLQREYTRPEGAPALLVLTTTPEAKRIYKAGAEVPFLGSGYTVHPAPPGLVRPQAGRSALIARRGEESWLVLATFGERRGRLGNGVLGWGLVAVDSTLGIPNDYYRASVMAPLTGLAPEDVAPVVALADTLFERLAGWYSGPVTDPAA
jgi:hypothetical protein